MLVALLVALAGCSGGGDRSDNIVVVDSGQTATVGPGSGLDKGALGDLRGFVLDEALRPVVGATVKLPGEDLTRRANQDGGFAFVDLIAGAYYLRADAAGFLPLESEIFVRESAVTEVRIILVRAPVEDPYHETQEFAGHTDFAQPANGWLYDSVVRSCGSCTWRLAIPQAADTLILEAVRSGGLGGQYVIELTDPQGAIVASATASDPARVEVPAGILGQRTNFYLDVQPYSEAAPEPFTFEAFATSFHNGKAPANWSVRGP